MAQSHQCPRCNASAFVRAELQSGGGGTPQIVMDAAHASPLAALVCSACGHVELVATDPRALRVQETREPPTQEYDF